jgi:hypothetical protein
LKAAKVTRKVPSSCEVPEITPVVVFRVNPLGNPPAANRVGNPEAVIVYVNGLPESPATDKSLLITGAWGFLKGMTNLVMIGSTRLLTARSKASPIRSTTASN